MGAWPDTELLTLAAGPVRASMKCFYRVLTGTNKSIQLIKSLATVNLHSLLPYTTFTVYILTKRTVKDTYGRRE